MGAQAIPDTTAASAEAGAEAGAVAGRVLSAAAGTLDILVIALGVRLGLLPAAGPA